VPGNDARDYISIAALELFAERCVQAHNDEEGNDDTDEDQIIHTKAPGHSPVRRFGWSGSLTILVAFLFCNTLVIFLAAYSVVFRVGVVKLRVNCVKKILMRRSAWKNSVIHKTGAAG